MHVDVAVSGAGLYDGNARALHAGANQRRAASRDEHVHEARRVQQLRGLRVLGVVVNVLERVGGKAGLLEGRAAGGREGQAGTPAPPSRP